MMLIFAYLLLAAFIALGFVGVILNLIGTFFILFGAVLFSWMTGLQILGLKPLVTLVILYLAGEVSDFILTSLGAKKWGASPWGIAASAVGGLIGGAAGAFFLGVGAIFGAFAGIFLGIFVVEMLIRKKISLSAKAAAGGVAGALGAVFFKLAVAVLMTGVIVYHLAVYWKLL